MSQATILLSSVKGGVNATLSRVILLPDGRANHGLCGRTGIERHCAAMPERGISTTTVGLGRGFNEDLMIAMARAGGGSQHDGQTVSAHAPMRLLPP